MVVLVTSWSSLNLGNVGSKTRSLGQISLKPCSPSGGHSFLQSSWNFDLISQSSQKMGHVRSKTRSLCQIYLKSYSPSRDHSFALISKNITKMFVLMISLSIRNMGHVGSKTRSLGTLLFI